MFTRESGTADYALLVVTLRQYYLVVMWVHRETEQPEQAEIEK
jgi:hypothetical protein